MLSRAIFSVRYAMESTHHEKKPFAKIRCLFNYNLCKATYHGLQRLQPNKRHFIIARGGFVGVHRYAGLWTGFLLLILLILLIYTPPPPPPVGNSLIELTGAEILKGTPKRYQKPADINFYPQKVPIVFPY